MADSTKRVRLRMVEREHGVDRWLLAVIWNRPLDAARGTVAKFTVQFRPDQVRVDLRAWARACLRTVWHLPDETGWPEPWRDIERAVDEDLLKLANAPLLLTEREAAERMVDGMFSQYGESGWLVLEGDHESTSYEYQGVEVGAPMIQAVIRDRRAAREKAVASVGEQG